MDKTKIIKNTIEFIKQKLHTAEGGHDWFHIERVCKNALLISQNENANTFIVEMSALLHDIADSKFHNGDETIGPKLAKEFLITQGVDMQSIQHIIKIIKHTSFKGGNFSSTFCSIELTIVQDADRLDAIGAIGIARCFNYGGYQGRALYDPTIRPNLEMTKEEYKRSSAPTINHFYEKLLLLKDKMNTTTGREIANDRHEFMLKFLDQFYGEWNGRDSQSS